MIPKYFGRLCNGTDADVMVRPPFMSPEPPMPATALPTISILDEVATAQRREPNSKMAKYVRNAYCHRLARHLNYRKKPWIDLITYLGLEVGVQLPGQWKERGTSFIQCIVRMIQ